MSTVPRQNLKGRGAEDNPRNRFERLDILYEPEVEATRERPKTEFLRDSTKSILSRNQSPDVGFDVSLNPYRGCEHGCAYCYARPTHEYLGFSAGLDFETRILVKPDAPELLERELARPSWTPQTLGLSGVTDPYQPIERRLEITRACLEVLARLRNPVAVVTKNHLVARDIDFLGELASHHAAAVFLSITSLDADLSRVMEPRASSPHHRLDAVAELAAAGVPCGVLVAPVVPAINDHEIPAILEAAADAGAQFASFIMLRLPLGVKEIFRSWLERHFPDRAEHVLSRIRQIRDGQLNDSSFGSRMRGTGIFARQTAALFRISAARFGLAGPRFELSTASFRRPGGEQMALF